MQIMGLMDKSAGEQQKQALDELAAGGAGKVSGGTARN